MAGPQLRVAEFVDAGIVKSLAIGVVDDGLLQPSLEQARALAAQLWTMPERAATALDAALAESIAELVIYVAGVAVAYERGDLAL